MARLSVDELGFAAPAPKASLMSRLLRRLVSAREQEARHAVARHLVPDGTGDDGDTKTSA